MSKKLLIIIAVQSALVVSIGGVAVGLSLRAPAPHHVKAKKPVVHDEDDAESESPAEEEAPPSKHAKHESPKHEPAKHDEEPAHEEAPPKKDAKHEAPAKHDEAPAKKDAKHDEPAKKLVDDEHELHALAGPKDPLEAFSWLDDGNGRWVQGVTKTRDAQATRASVTRQFTPWAMVVTCADGRVTPETIFDVAPGALASVRLVTLKPEPALLTASDVAVRRFGPRVLVVLGHAGCDDGSGREMSAQVTALTQKLYSKKSIRQQLQKNALLVLRATYDLESGKVRWLDSEDAHDESASASPVGGH